jgi:hypothetical protein
MSYISGPPSPYAFCRENVLDFYRTGDKRADYNCSTLGKAILDIVAMKLGKPNLRHWQFGGDSVSAFSGSSQGLGHATVILRTASRIEQLNAPARAYHQRMKRELPVTCCTECGAVGYNMRVANGRCCKTVGEQRCTGVNATAVKNLDWIECALCEATGYYRNKECPKCKGAGYLFVGLTGKETVA